MNRGMLFPVLGALTAVAYATYELTNHDYDTTSPRFPILPNGILEIDPKAKELSTNPEQGKSKKQTEPRTSQEPDKTPRVDPKSAPLAAKNVESSEEKSTKKPSNETITRSTDKAKENKSPIVSEKSSNASSANLISPVASSNAGERYDVAATSLQKKESGYEPDTKGFNKVGKHSMAYKYKDNVLLVPAEHPVGKEKNKKIKDMFKNKSGKGIGAYGKGYVRESDIHEQFANQFCKTALEYSEGTTFWTIGISKKYLDFLWLVCGRDDKPKPNGWWGK